MSLVLLATSGPREGETFPLRDGLTIGRQDADVALDDRRVSSLHAQVSGAGDGAWLLTDVGSKNGLRDAGGERVDSLKLTPGTSFVIGSTTFLVKLIEERAAVDSAPKAALVSVEPTRRYWHQVLAEFLEAHAAEFKDRPRALAPLEPALILEFTRGAQTNTKWILGYGPRRVGAAALDLPIWEADAPDVCFEIHPSAEGLVFRTAHASVVQLNGRAVDTEVLRMGDTIHIRDTLIEVDFSE